MKIEKDFGLNVLQRMLGKGFEEYGCDELEFMSYNVNLDLVIKLLNKYKNLKKITIWSNSDKILFSNNNRNELVDKVEKERIFFHHIPENANSIHGKIYFFKKEGTPIFTAIGSPNFTGHSNQNVEFLLYIYDIETINLIAEDIPKIFQSLNLFPESRIPVQLFSVDSKGTIIDPKFLSGLWKHQIATLEWLASRKSSIVNIPPGTGKTNIALRYMQYLFETNENITSIVLVPTKTLIDQWRNRLDGISISNLEWGTSLTNLGSYFASPNHRVLITLYSRFFDQYVEFLNKCRIMKPNVLLILDECHNSYGHLDTLQNFRKLLEAKGSDLYSLGLSATIDSFRVDQVNNFIELFGGSENRFEITLQSFYAQWNDINQTPVLKPIEYKALKCELSDSEMEKFKEFSKKIAIEMQKKSLDGENLGAAMQRAKWLRSLPAGIAVLENYIISNIYEFANTSTLVFVQTNEIAEKLQQLITRHPAWNPEASIYVYDSTRDEEYLSYALNQFKNNKGFCLISEKMLSEGFDLPKVDRVILHGSDTSPRDWIQKVGRAMRYNKSYSDSIANIIDIVFCDTNGDPLRMEFERYQCLSAISQSR